MQQYNIGVRGELDVDVQKVDGSGKVLASRRVLTNCPNLITNAGMDAFGQTGSLVGTSGNSFARRCQVGTGTTPPAYTDTTLAARVAAAAPDTNGFVYEGQTAVATSVFTFAAGTATGNISEVGLSSVDAGYLNTRALLTDEGGVPITVTVLEDEQLVITYRVVFSFSGENTSSHSTSPTPQTYTLTITTAEVGVSVPSASLPLGGSNSTSSWFIYHGPASGLGPITGVPTGNQTQATSGTVSTSSYVPGSYYRDLTRIFPIDQYNGIEIGAIRFSNRIPFGAQVGIVPRFVKSAGETLRITIRLSWSRE